MKIEPVGFMTEHDEGPMYWDSLADALTYCDLGVDPEKLYTEAQLRQLGEACAQVAGPEDSYQDEWFNAKADAVNKINARIKELLS